MFITGEEIRAVYELEGEYYEFTRLDGPTKDEEALEVESWFGGNRRRYVIWSDDGEISGVVEVPEEPKGAATRSQI